MAKKIDILLTGKDQKQISRDYYSTSVKTYSGGLTGWIAREAQRKMWKRLIELGMIREHHDCTDFSRTGHSPDHSPFCRWCRITKELGLNGKTTSPRK